MRELLSLPSTVVARIDQYWEFPAKEQAKPPPDSAQLDCNHSDKVEVIYKLCQQLHPTVLPTGSDRARYDQALSAMNQALERWIHAPDRRNVSLGKVKFNDRWTNPITVVRTLLSRCPDEPVAALAGHLAFITDTYTREDLARDIEDTRWAVENHRWKMATVIAGAAIEALLLWALQQVSHAQRQAAIVSVIRKKSWGSAPPNDLKDWRLFQYIAVAEELHLIEARTAIQAIQAKDFRNLIHPGLAQARDRQCSEATALAARSGVLLVIEDLARHFP